MQLPNGEVEQVEKPINFSDEIGKSTHFSIYTGGEGSGKTTILKKLFRSAQSSELIPVFINCDDITNSKFHDIERFINGKFKEQYDVGEGKSYAQFSKEKN